MATNIQALYSDIVGDLVPYISNKVMLPMLAGIQYNIAGGAGEVVKVPVQSAFADAGTVAAGGSITGTANDMNTSAISVAVSKLGAGSRINMEDLENGGMDVVRANLIAQLSSALAQGIDKAGFVALSTGVTDHGLTPTGTGDVASVFSPQALAYVSKREPVVKMFENIDTDSVDFAATVRMGYGLTRTDWAATVTSNNDIDSGEVATLAMFAKAVAALRGSNAPTDMAGFYHACISPVQEFQLASQLNSVTQTTVGDLSMVGNDALRLGVVSQAIGLNFYRSNNLTSV